MMTHLTVDRVGGCDHTTPGIQRGVDSSFGDSDGLLLHDFVDGDSIDFRHLVEFIDTHHTSIGEDHGTCL